MRWRTEGQARRARARRHLGLRAVADELGWSVLGEAGDLSERYPVPVLEGARSARAELAVGGAWDGQEARVLLAVVRSGVPGRGEERTVLLTVLGTTGAGRGADLPVAAAERPATTAGRSALVVRRPLLAALRGPEPDVQGPADVWSTGSGLVHARPLRWDDLLPDPRPALHLLTELAGPGGHGSRSCTD